MSLFMFFPDTGYDLLLLVKLFVYPNRCKYIIFIEISSLNPYNIPKDEDLSMDYDFLKNTRKDQKCKGILKCRMIEPALAAFFGVENPTELKVPVRFLIHNTWCFNSPNKDQYLTLLRVNGIKLEYKVPYTSQDGDVDLWETIDKGNINLNIMLGIDSFYITNVSKVE